MVYIYLPAAYYHVNLYVTKENLLAAGFSAVPAVFLVFLAMLAQATCILLIFLFESIVSFLRTKQ